MARVFDNTSGVCLDVKVSLKIPRTESKVVSEGNGPAYPDESGSGKPTMVENLWVLKRSFEEMDNHFDRMKSRFDQQDKWFEESKEEIKNKINQCLAGLQLQAQQPRLVAKEGVKQGMKTPERKENAAAGAEKFGDVISSVRADDDAMSWTSFGKTAKRLALTKYSDDFLVAEGVEAPKPGLSSVEIRTSTHTGGLLHVGSAPITLRTIFPPQPLPWSFCENTEKRGHGATTRRKSSTSLPLLVA